MAHHHFYRDEARDRAARVVREIESRTAVQVVVALRVRSDPGRAADYLFGFLTSLAVLVALVYLPISFSIESVPVDSTLAFAVGAILCARLPALRRLLTPRKAREDQVRRAACTAFVEHGLTRTKARLGLLVFVSLFERRVELLPDVGIDLQALGPDWTAAIRELQESIERGPDVDRFIAAFGALGPLLARVHPRGTGPVEELPDEIAEGGAG